MQLVNEQDDLPVRLLDFFQHGFEPVFKLAAIFCAGQHRSQVEGDHALVAQDIRHVSVHNAARKTLDDSSFAHARLADEHGIVLGPPRKHLDHAPDLLVAPDHRIELAAPRQLGQVLRVFLKRLVLRLRILIRHALIAAHRRQAFEDRIVIGSKRRQQQLRAVILQAREGEQQMLGRNVIVLKLLCLFERRFEHLVQRVARAGLRRGAADFRKLIHRLLGARFQLPHGHANLVEDGRNHALFVAEQHRQQMQRQNLGVAVLRRKLAGALHRLLRLHRKLVPPYRHNSSSFG